MKEKDIIENRVANSGLITLDLEDILDSRERVVYDLKDNLFQGLILREKEFRVFLKENDWANYKDQHVSIICSADAIVPTWAYMLLVTRLKPFAASIVFGDLEALEKKIIDSALNKIDFSIYQDAKLVIKGCAELGESEYAFVEVTNRLLPYASSIMYGEPCSTVPIYKKPRKK